MGEWRAPCGGLHNTHTGIALGDCHASCWISPVRAWIATNYSAAVEEEHAYTLRGVETESPELRGGLREDVKERIVRGLAERGLVPLESSEARDLALLLAQEDEALFVELSGSIIQRWTALLKFYDTALAALFLSPLAHPIACRGEYTSYASKVIENIGCELAASARMLATRSNLSARVQRAIDAARKAGEVRPFREGDSMDDCPDAAAFVLRHSGRFGVALGAFAQVARECANGGKVALIGTRGDT